MLKSKLVLIYFLAPIIVSAKIWVYPSPGEKVTVSPVYIVKVIQEAQEAESFTCFSQATFGDLERSSSWTTFSFNNKIEIEVEVLGEAIRDFVIRPKSKDIEGQIVENKIRIELSKPEKLCIEINGNNKNPLFIFADKPEENIPEKNGKGLWFFEPGVHEIGWIDLPDTVKHIYIAGGAYVEGAFRNKNRTSNIKITGRGILCSPNQEDSEPNSPIIDLSGEGINSYIEGITILDGIAGGIEMQQSYSTLRNCKILSWNSSNGGVFCGPHALVEDCFFRCNSDVIKIYRNFIVVEQCIFWQNEKGAPFQMGWNLREDFHNFRISDCDVIHCEHEQDANNAAVFSAVHGGAGNLSNYLFEDIRIEGDVFRLFKLTIRTNKFDEDVEYGSISNIEFKNIILEGKCVEANEIWGYNQEHVISTVTFENLEINGQKILNADDGNFKLNLNTTSGIVFK